MIEKPRRKQDRELIKYIKEELWCIACGEPSPEAHHVKTRGAGGDDVAKNLIPVCRRHHNMFHSKGAKYMRERFEPVNLWFEQIEKIEKEGEQ